MTPVQRRSIVVMCRSSCRLLSVAAVAVLLISCSSSPTEPERWRARWDHARSLSSKRVDRLNGDLDLTLTFLESDGKVCLDVLLDDSKGLTPFSPSDFGRTCTDRLSDQSAPVQALFVQSEGTLFAEADGKQLVAGVVDDRIDHLEMESESGQILLADVGQDGVFVVQPPLDFVPVSIRATGPGVLVACDVASLAEFAASQSLCAWK